MHAGLTEHDAKTRLTEDGPNELPRARQRTVARILAEVIREPMLALLLVGGGLYLLFGDLHEALILLVFASFSVAITVIQESRTERMLEALRDLTSPRALVVRDGRQRRIPGREVVRGDLLVLGEGDRVPADARLVVADELRVDESLLTGESVPVAKRVAISATEPVARPGGDDSPFVYSGSLVVRGGGLATVVATGEHSEIGRIGKSLAQVDTEVPRLRVQTLRLVRIFGLLGGTAAVLAAVLYGLARQDWLEGALAGIALGMAMLPEEFPMVLTVFMAMGAWRISRAKVLTRRASAIESLGAATILCTDKTGTLTQNRMTVRNGWNGAPCAPGQMGQLALYGLLAAAPQPVDPMDVAFHDLASEHGLSPDHPAGRWLRMTQAFGLRADLLAVTQIWQDADGAQLAAAKGAPEAIVALCGLTAPDAVGVKAAVADMAAEGLRVLGVACADVPPGASISGPRDLTFRFVGLVGLVDPLRPSAKAAVQDCRRAGIRVVMITGDHAVTARAIAAEAGLDTGDALSGQDVTGMDDAALTAAVADVTVFSRVLPEQKLRIVTAFKARGDIVAMTGDGVNDAPSLKAAHIGIAMGGRGTDVAREASSIVLLDDDFGSIVRAIRLGRRIYDNLRKAMGFIVAIHIPIAGMALLPLLLGMPIILTPIHIAFLEMIIDPVCSLVFEAEPEERDVMDRPPRSPDAQLFSRPMLMWSMFQGAATLGIVVAVYLFFAAQDLPVTQLRALTFLTLAVGIVTLIYVNRSFAASPLRAFARPSLALVGVPVLVGAALALILTVPVLGRLFGFGPLRAMDIGTSLAACGLLFLALEGVKAVAGRRLLP
ncbi:MAG: cation-translocating P-type ATPase [Pseudomonadota bacterium]